MRNVFHLVAGILLVVGPVRAELTEQQVIAMETATSWQKVKQSGAKGILAIGAQTHIYDRVICVPGMFKSAIGSNLDTSTDSPEVLVTIYEPNDPESSVNTVKVMFNDAQDRVNWQRVSGSVAKTSDAFEAYGSLKGLNMVEQPDGTLKPVPIEGPNVEFAVILSCN